MAAKVKVEKFERVNKSQLKMTGKRTRTGASTEGAHRAHGNNYKKHR